MARPHGDDGPVETLVPTAMVAGGDALARDGDGRVVFVRGALPGEAVRVQVVDDRGDYRRAEVVEILEPSPDRVAPPCAALSAGCGGCAWQHVSAAAQGRMKAEMVVDALRRIGRMTDPPRPVVQPLAGPALRTTARLGVGPDGRAGHRRRGRTADVVPTADCLAAHPLLAELLVDGRYPGAGRVVLRAGVASGERLVQVDAGAAAVVVPSEVVVVRRGDGGTAFVHEEVAGRRLRVSADSFFQAGPVAAAALVDAVVDAVAGAVGPGGHVVDAYAGVGLFATALGARYGARITAIESQEAAAADARANLTGVDARVVVGEVGRWRGEPADAVVADPARSGLGRPGVTALT
ncbi:MAG: class I SAM-dependent RNA methyltransferase, partial [Acidimicrobiales bacterium]